MSVKFALYRIYAEYVCAIAAHDPFQGMNHQGVYYAQTPCWSLLAMPVPDVHSKTAAEYRRLERRAQRLFS